MPEEPKKQQVSAIDAINWIANHALRAPLTPAEQQEVNNFRQQLVAMMQPPPDKGKKKGK